MSDDTCAEESGIEHLARLGARGFVVAGGLFWMAAAFSGPFVYEGMSLSDSMRVAMWPLLATAVTLLVGWHYERLASVLLVAASAAVVVWGTLYAWEFGLWMLMTAVLIAPMIVAALLFVLAAHSEEQRSHAEEPRPAAPISAFGATRDTRAQPRLR